MKTSRMSKKSSPTSKRDNSMFKDTKIAMICFSSFFLLVFSVVLSKFAPDATEWDLVTIILATVSSTVFFPLIAGYYYDKFREKQEGESIWRVFKEFSDGGILRVYKDREASEDEENAVTALGKAFEEHHEGEVKLMGVTLRVFFNPVGPFYEKITIITNLHKDDDNVRIRALVCDPNDNPEVVNRARIETPDKLSDPTIRREIHSTIDFIQNLNKEYGITAVDYGYYSSAPYCTLIIFPNKCYFSPNILSKDAPVRLPMIVFNEKSHGYTVLNRYFNYLWENKIKHTVSERVN